MSSGGILLDTVVQFQQPQGLLNCPHYLLHRDIDSLLLLGCGACTNRETGPTVYTTDCSFITSSVACTLPEGSRAGCDQWQWGVGQLWQVDLSEAKADDDIYPVWSGVLKFG